MRGAAMIQVHDPSLRAMAACIGGGGDCRHALARRTEALAATTVLLADLPQTLEDLVAGILSDVPAVTLRRGSIGSDGLVATAMQAGAGVVVVARDQPDDLADVDPAFATAASILVLALAPQADRACLHRLDPGALRLGDVSAADLRAAVARCAGEG